MDREAVRTGGSHVQQGEGRAFLLATEDGMGPTAAAEFAGVSVGAAKKWEIGRAHV